MMFCPSLPSLSSPSQEYPFLRLHHLATLYVAAWMMYLCLPPSPTDLAFAWLQQLAFIHIPVFQNQSRVRSFHCSSVHFLSRYQSKSHVCTKKFFCFPPNESCTDNRYSGCLNFMVGLTYLAKTHADGDPQEAGHMLKVTVDLMAV